MRLVRFHGVTLAAIVCLCLQTAITTAQDGDLPRPSDGYGNGGGTRGFRLDADFASYALASSSRTALPEEFRDPAFEHYVQLTMVGEAIAARDASLLADVALQLAQAERILLRKHRSGIVASTLIGKAAKLASDTQDKATLDRVKTAVDALQDEDLIGQIKTTERFIGSSRTAAPAVSVQIQDVDANTLLQIKEWLDSIRTAEVVVDLESLRGIRSELETSDALNDEQRAAIVTQIDGIIAAAPVPDAQDELLLKLTAASRPHNRGERESQLRARFGGCITFGGEYSAMTAVLTALDVYAPAVVARRRSSKARQGSSASTSRN